MCIEEIVFSHEKLFVQSKLKSIFKTNFIIDVNDL